jgi:putative transcriptional regulator
MYHFTDGGLRNVWLKNGYTEHKTKYGKGVSIQDLDGLTEAICQALIKKPSKLTGAEFRYIRSNMLMSQKSLAKMLGYTEQAVAKWEKTGKIPKSGDALIRLIFAAQHNGNQKISTMIDTLNFIDRIANTKIIVSEARNKWTSKIEIENLPIDESCALAA